MAWGAGIGTGVPLLGCAALLTRTQQSLTVQILAVLSSCILATLGAVTGAILGALQFATRFVDALPLVRSHLGKTVIEKMQRERRLDLSLAELQTLVTETGITLAITSLRGYVEWLALLAKLSALVLAGLLVSLLFALT